MTAPPKIGDVVPDVEKSVFDQRKENKRLAQKNRIIVAFEDYAAGKPGAETKLYLEVQEFAAGKLFYHENDKLYRKLGTTKTSDDYVSDVAVGILKGLQNNTFPNGLQFYRYLNSTTHHKVIDFKKMLYKQCMTKVPLEVERDVDSGGNSVPKGQTIENPKLQRDDVGGYALGGFRFPPHLQGIDRNICISMLGGMNQKQTAEILNMSESAVNKRIERLWGKMESYREMRKIQRGVVKPPPFDYSGFTGINADQLSGPDEND